MKSQLGRWYRHEELSERSQQKLGIPHLVIDDASLARIEAESISSVASGTAIGGRSAASAA